MEGANWAIMGIIGISLARAWSRHNQTDANIETLRRSKVSPGYTHQRVVRSDLNVMADGC